MKLLELLRPAVPEREEEEYYDAEHEVHYVKTDLAVFNSESSRTQSRQCSVDQPPSIHTCGSSDQPATLSPRRRPRNLSDLKDQRLTITVRDLETEEPLSPSKVKLTYIKHEEVHTSLEETGDTAPVGKRSIGGLVIPPVGEHRVTIIFLHGLGDRPHTWAPFLTRLNIDGAKLILPKARKMSVKAALFFRMPAWFNIYKVGEDDRVDRKGLNKVLRHIESIVESEVRQGIPSECIFIAGFSQGGAVALTLAQMSKYRFAGIIAMSSWLPLMSEPLLHGEHKAQMPVLFCHGDKDPLVASKRAIKSAYSMEGMNMRVQVHLFPGLGHDIHNVELETVKRFIEEHIPEGELEPAN